MIKGPNLRDRWQKITKQRLFHSEFNRIRDVKLKNRVKDFKVEEGRKHNLRKINAKKDAQN